MKMALLVCLCTVLASTAFAAVKCSFSLGSPAAIGSTELKSGDYDIRADGATAVISPRFGKPFTVPAKLETLETKSASKTAVESVIKDGKKILTSITPGNSKVRIVFEP